jgi:predicted aspartyl protease
VHQLEFTSVHSYAAEREGISVPVLLKSGANRVHLAASIDTGATFCIFRNEVAAVLGLNTATGTPKRFRTANSSFDAFGHEIEISVLGVATFSVVYFFADVSINKNVLGRIGWLDRVRLGLVDHDSRLYVGPYDHE